MARVDVNSLMQQAYHMANNRLNVQNAVARTPAAAPLLDVSAAGVQAVEKSAADIKLAAVDDIMIKVQQQLEATNMRAAQLGAAMQGATAKATGGSQ